MAEALSQDDLRISDISNALKSEGKLALVFDTRVSVTAVTTVTAAAAYCTAAALADTARSLTLQEGWECRMAFVKELCATIGGVWNADLSVDLRDEFGLSERVMDGIRFSISHEIVSGRPRPRILVSNPHNKRQKVFFPQPVQSRCAWTRRMREREEAMQLVAYDEDKTCERDFDTTLDDLIERDKALLRGGFSSARPLAPVLGFDGAANFTHVTLRLTDYSDVTRT